MAEQIAEQLDHREVQPTRARDESEPIPLSRPEGNPIQVLIADDDAISRRLLQRTLERSGFDVVCVDDGLAAAERMLAPDGPRIAILDWMMPGKDGPSICKELRACTANPYVYLILLTSRGAKEDIVMGLEAGADDYLIKPYNVDEMKARIRAGQRILQLQDRLVHDACHDALTKLPNRSFFLRRLSDSANKARNRESYRFAVLFVDIDRFKTINDSIGHIAGDELMKGVALRLLHAVRTETAISRKKDARDMGKGFNDVVARIGGDEFVILLDDISSVNDATQVAERIQTVLKPPFLISGQEVYVTASIGISEGEGRGVDTTTVLRGADTAMYKAKTQGRARYEVSDPIGQAAAAHALRLEHDLRLAIDKQELEVQYQPIVALQGCRITGFEALARWKHPELGYVPPDTFIPIAEDTGLIRPIGKWVMHEACRQMQAWNAEFATNDPVVVCVNIAPRQFEPRKLLACVSEILAETGLQPGSLDLEVTENLTMQDAEQAGEILRNLAALGVSISLDDFGTGYSSLSYLHRFPIGTLKIDRSFIAELETSKESREIVQTIIALGHGLGMKVIAEGIETVEQMELLRDLHCDLGQGYLFSRPATAQQVPQMLAARRSGATLTPHTPVPRNDAALSAPLDFWNTPAGELAGIR